ncbi:MAG: polyphosphate kinase 2 family protein [Treponemataceae bacterium]
MKTEKYLVTKKINLKDFSTKCEENLERDEVENKLMPENLKLMEKYQDKLYAESKQGLLIVIQAMDTAGKDGLIRHVMTSFNPQGVYVATFKVPSTVELAHDYLWRVHQFAPRRGGITIFNRSHYEDVIIARVHNLVKNQNLPDRMKSKNIWDERYEQIRNYEKYLNDNGIEVVKFFLHISKEEQKERLLARIDKPEKNWKFSGGDIEERAFWDDYQKAYEKAINETSTKHSRWYIIPSDQKWFSRYLVSEIVVETFKEMNPQFPTLPKEKLAQLQEWKEMLLNEK